MLWITVLLLFGTDSVALASAVPEKTTSPTDAIGCEVLIGERLSSEFQEIQSGLHRLQTSVRRLRELIASSSAADLFLHFKDIRTQAIQLRDRTIELAERALTLKGQHHAQAIHDIKNRINPLTNLTELVFASVGVDGQRPLQPAELDHIDSILSMADLACERSIGVTKRLIQGKSISPQFEKVSIQVLFNESLVASRGFPKAIQVSAADVSGLPLILADSLYLGDAILNLITNANQALKGRSGKISLRAEIQDLAPDKSSNETVVTERDRTLVKISNNPLAPTKYLVISVSDTGPGMTPAVMRKLPPAPV